MKSVFVENEMDDASIQKIVKQSEQSFSDNSSKKNTRNMDLSAHFSGIVVSLSG